MQFITSAGSLADSAFFIQKKVSVSYKLMKVENGDEMKKIKRIIFVILILMIAFVSYKYIVFKSYQVNNGSAKQQLVQRFRSDESSLNLKDAFSFEWTEAYIFGAYTDDEDIRKTIKSKWIPQYSFLEYLVGTDDHSLLSDGRKKIIFINEDRVVKDIVFNSSDFDINESKLSPSDRLILIDAKSHTYVKE